MAPEQVRGQRCDERTDIFAFGCVLYEMLAGRRAFPGDTASGSSRVLTDDPPALRSVRPSVPLSIEQLVGRCLEKRPDDRFASIQDLAWALEAASGGGPHDVASPRGRLWLRVASAILVAGLVGALTWLGRDGLGGQARAGPGHHHARSAVAVLPLRNLSPDPANAYFAGGLHDELLTQLSKMASLQVISRTSVMGYHDTTKSLTQIARELQVGSVVEGTIQVLGGRLRVTVRLLDAATDRQVWAERYDRSLDDAFAVQSEVAQRIVAAVGVALSPDEQGRLTAAPTTSPEAYRDYLQGREYRTRPGYVESNLRSAQLLFERAVERDPGFALAHAALADVHSRIAWMRYDTSSARVARMRDEADTALRLAPGLPQAHLAKGLVHYQAMDYRLALREIDTALETLPGDAELWAYKGYAHRLPRRRLGALDEALAAFASAARLNPRAADVFWDLGGETLGLAHRYEEAVAAYDRALSLAPDLHVVAVLRAWMHVRWRGDLGPVRSLLDSLPPDADLTIWSTVASHRALLLLFERDAAGLLKIPELGNGTDFKAQTYFVPATLYAAWAHQLRGDGAAARAAFESARVRLQAAVQETPGDWRVHVSHGLALAGLGLRDEAIAEAEWLRRSGVYNRDAHFGTMAAEGRARILAQAGSAGAALDEIERLLRQPSWLSVPMLRLDPRWDPLRAQPRFVALLKRNPQRP